MKIQIRLDKVSNWHCGLSEVYLNFNSEVEFLNFIDNLNDKVILELIRRSDDTKFYDVIVYDDYIE